MDPHDDHCATQLSAQELRKRRLVSLGILEPQNIVVQKQNSAEVPKKSKVDEKWVPTNVINLLDDSDEENEENNKTQVPQNHTKAALKLDDDDDDDDSVSIDLIDAFNSTVHGKSNRDTSFRKKDPQENSKRKRNDNVMIGDAKQLPDASTSTMAASMQTTTADCTYHSLSTDGNRSSWNFQVATWNVWFGPLADGTPHPGPRMRSIVRLLMEHNQDINNPLLFIGLQEVVDELATVLIPALDSVGFRVYRQPRAIYGCAVAVDKRLEIVSHAWHRYSDTVMDRGYYHVRAKLPNKSNPNACPEVIFTTTHLESWNGPQYTGAAQRIPQLQEMEEYCNHALSIPVSSDINYYAASMAIMTGDMNWDDERQRSSTTPLDPPMFSVLSEFKKWHDAWLSTRTALGAGTTVKKTIDPGYTYDAKVNPMLGGNLRRRFDRCLVRASVGSASTFRRTSTKVDDTDGTIHNEWTALPLETILLGREAIPDLTWEKLNPYKETYTETKTAPSDHFGVLSSVQLSFQNKHTTV